MHAGHDLMLEDAAQYCDKLVVLLQTDPSIERPTTKAPPVQRLHARFTELRLNRHVAKIVLYEREQEHLGEFLRRNARVNGGFIDVRIIGEDYVGKDFTGSDAPIEVVYNWRKHRYSTTLLRDDTVAAEPKRVAMRTRARGGISTMRAAAAPAR
jgi:glycerol-3-phosphate cytidylyltransferase